MIPGDLGLNPFKPAFTRIFEPAEDNFKYQLIINIII